MSQANKSNDRQTDDQINPRVSGYLPGSRFACGVMPSSAKRAVVFAACLGMLATGVAAQTEAQTAEAAIFFPMAQIFTFLFLMLGPIRTIGPFVKLTAGAEPELERKMALAATFFSGIALLIAGLLGEMILRKFGVPLPILALAAGGILFLVALQNTIRQSSSETSGAAVANDTKPTLKLALDPLAFPIIATPYGIAALIVFLAFAPDIQAQLTIGAIVVAILLLNYLAMLFARKLLASLGVALAILGAVLSVVQVALGLQIISNSLKALGAV